MDQPYLNRADAPLEPRDWEALDHTVVEVARRTLVGRRFLGVFGPLGAGVQDLDYDLFGGTGAARISVFGETAPDPVLARRRIHENLPLIYKDFMLFWRDLETARQLDSPLDVSAAAAAASLVAQQEDELIFHGNADLGYAGLLTVTGRTTLQARDWGQAGHGFADVVDARARLLESGFAGPYAVALNPRWFSHLHRVYANSGVLEINHLRELATAGVFQAAALREGEGLIMSVGMQNADLAVGQDLVTAYLGVEQLNHPFRVFESLVLRIKRPGAICTFEGPA